jgi:S-adenosylmethionine decarboxylase
LRISDSNSPEMGSHTLLNVYGCGEIDRLLSLALFRAWAGPMLARCGAEIVDVSGYQFQPFGEAGFTYLALLTTSHFSIHTWPEYRSAAIDVFTCGTLVDTDRIVAELAEFFSPTSQTVQFVLR